MIRCYRNLTILLLLICPAGLVHAQETNPGVRDTLRLHSVPLVVGVSSPVTISIFNDSTVSDFDFVLLLESLDSGFAKFDSARFIGRMADPTVLPLRIVNTLTLDELNPDTLMFACLQNAFTGLSPGDGEVMELYFTGLTPGKMTIDTVTGTSGISLDFVTSGGREYVPTLQPGQIDILLGIDPPAIRLVDSSPVVSTIGESVTFTVTGTSPVGLPVSLALMSLTDTDTDLRLPLAEPDFAVIDSTARFVWQPAAADVGIWTATFVVTDSLGQRATSTAEIQVVSDSRYLIEFGLSTNDNAPYATGLGHGDYDGDDYPELLLSAAGFNAGPSVALYDYFPGAGLEKSFEITCDDYTRALVSLFLPGDEHLDVVMCYIQDIASLKGDGRGTLELSTDLSPISGVVRNATTIDFNSDRYLDYAIVNTENVIIFQGTEPGGFLPAATWPVGDTGLTVNSADFNNDGWDDLAVGTVTGLEIYVNNQMGGYEAGASYEQRFGATDIEITSRGADFNSDGTYDLCLATPSAGGTRSDLVIYFGAGDATFTPSLVRTVRGQILAACPGDFNGDGFLDIAYINGSHRYLGLLLGDGTGSFSNELRYSVPQYPPRRLDCLDIDLDGDLDIVVSAYDLSTEVRAALYLFTNQLDPIGVVNSDLHLEISGNADFELRAPNGGRLNRVSNSLASAELYWKALDGEDDLGAWVTCPSLRIGRHDLVLTPRPDQNPGESFSLEFELQGQTYQIARNQPMGEAGFIFPIDPSGSSGLSPRQGEFIQTALPTFTWETSGVERFELTADLSFADIIETAVVSGGIYTLQMVLPYTDSATYYWRVNPEAGAAVSPIYAFNVVRVPTGVDDPHGLTLLPDSCWLAQNYPNPFNPTTTLTYHMAEGGMVSITIHNVLGQLINTLIDGPVPSGTYTVDWDATDLNNQPVASGIYFYRMESGEFSSTRKMVLVR